MCKIRSLYLLKAASPNKNNKNGFLNPEVITADTHMDTDTDTDTDTDVVIYLTEALNCVRVMIFLWRLIYRGKIIPSSSLYRF